MSGLARRIGSICWSAVVGVVAWLLVLAVIVWLVAGSDAPALAGVAAASPAAELDAEHASMSVQLPMDVLREYGYAIDGP